MCVFMLGKVGCGKPQMKQYYLGGKPCEVCEADDMLLDVISWAE